VRREGLADGVPRRITGRWVVVSWFFVGTLHRNSGRDDWRWGRRKLGMVVDIYVVRQDKGPTDADTLELFGQKALREKL